MTTDNRNTCATCGAYILGNVTGSSRCPACAEKRIAELEATIAKARGLAFAQACAGVAPMEKEMAEPSWPAIGEKIVVKSAEGKEYEIAGHIVSYTFGRDHAGAKTRTLLLIEAGQDAPVEQKQ